MRCPQCDAEISDQFLYCPKCGERLRGLGAESFAELRENASQVPEAKTSAGLSRAAASREDAARRSTSGGLTQAPASAAAVKSSDAVTLWEGRFSLRGMIDAIAVSGLASVAVVAVAIWRGWGLMGWVLLGCCLIGLWLWLFLLYLCRRLRHYYRLTPETFFHQRGLLIKSTSPIEIIRIDDIALHQTILQRLLNVGTIRILSNDTTDPVLVLKGIPDVQKAFAVIDQARRAERRRRALRVDSV